MITGFNPTDMYAADHIRRVLTTFPGVFSGIGEFTIHKEFVSSKIAGETASLLNPALDRIFDFAGEVGLVVLLHNDVDMPFPKPGPGARTRSLQLRDLIKRHPRTTVIWAHAGLGRVVRPVKDQLGMMDRGLASPDMRNFYVDLSWDEVAKYVVASPETIKATADLITRYPDRFLFGTDEVGPTDRKKYMTTYDAVRAAAGRPVSGGEREVSQGELRAAVRRGQAEGEGVGACQREVSGGNRFCGNVSHSKGG